MLSSLEGQDISMFLTLKTNSKRSNHLKIDYMKIITVDINQPLTAGKQNSKLSKRA